ncbi:MULTISPECIES: T9SS type A sorting domain-containing protein [Emticicia]|uniref:T9SS type A sorting domain-containing protein n=1 Tax=Emticicia TaxID=312278 RepID=UPI0007D8A952|nr:MULTISPECIES: T9SS type A sorting domain-containing protein [Emticicia]
MKKVKILILLLLLLGQGKILFAQFQCGTPSPNNQQKQELLELFQQFKQQKNARAINNYRVAVKANVVSGTNASSFLNESDVRAIITNANLYLQNINIQLYLYNDKVFQIKSDQYADFKIVDEAALRQANDVSDAINIYFVKYITLQNLTILSGYAALPSYAASTNRIFYSYFERTEDDFNNLKNKTFLHEIGHYFGLLHTFQDSNHADISKRELVTRGAGSNCVSTGDQLCDTQADPFERLPLIYAFNCDEKTPSNLQDAHGNTFSPPIDNIMSYQQRCGNVFTEQQYQKMQASFAIRFSPLAEYQIVSRNSNFLSVDELDKKVYCVGDSVKIKFNLEGMFENNNQLFVDISDKNGKNFQRIESKFIGDKIAIKLPFTLPEGDNYRIRLTATRPETISPISEHFAVRTYPSATISSTNANINAGESTNLVVNLDGSGAWSFQLSDGTLVENFLQNSYVISKSPTESTSYSIISVKNMCGTGSISGSATINVIQPQIQAEALSTSTICQGQNIRLSISIIGKLSSNSQLVIQISDPTGNNYTDLPTQVSLFTLSAQIPMNFQTGSGYRIKVAAKNTNYFSSVLGPLSIIPPPQPPVVVENYTFCQNSATAALTAIGTNLKWYTGELDIKPFLNITPPTGNVGILSYFVSQSNSYGCESKKAKINVTIIPLATATISGDASLLNGDSTLLKVNLTGELPAELKLSDGRSFIANQTPFIIKVKPSKSTTYTLKEIKNSCGLGFINGSAKITILEPLAAEKPVENIVNIFPNPTSEQFVVEFFKTTSKNAGISITDINGRIIQERKLKGIGKQEEIFNIDHYSSGIYLIKSFFDDKTIIKKIVIEK